MVELKIIFTDTGQVQVHGPLENKVLCYGLLEVARDVVTAHQAQQSRIVQAASVFPAGVKKQ